MRKIKLFGLVLISLLIFKVDPAFAQHYLGTATSNYSGIMGADLQPASIADSRYKFDMNLFSFSIDAAQNAKYFDPSVLPRRNWPYSLLKNDYWMNDPTIDIYEDFVHDQNAIDGRNKNSGLYLNTQFDILNFMVSINPKISVGFSAKVRFLTNIDNLEPVLLRQAEESLNYPALYQSSVGMKEATNLSINSMAWAEYGFNYAQVIKDEGEHFWKMGGRLKINRGLGAAYFHSKNLKFGVDRDTIDNYLDIEGNISYGYSDNMNDLVEGNTSNNNLYDVVSKFGLGLDLGVVYEWRPDWEEYKYDMDGETDLWRRDQNKYKLRIGASLLDLGGMTFKKGDLSRNFSVMDNKFYVKDVFEDVESPRGFTEVVDSLITHRAGWDQKEDTAQTFFMNTPTALSFQFDYNIYKDFYVNATTMLNLNPKSGATNVRVPSQVSVTPSYDHKWVGVGVPLSYNSYSGVRTGLGLRLGPLTVGTPDIKTIFPVGKKQRGGGIYASLRVPIPYGKPKDRDNDGVSNKLDECPDVPGTWETKGCPDTDGDGIPDHLDECPDVAGVAEFNGCPDTDGDGIPDHLDECPDVAGLAEFNGCPDTDGDGIPDHLDECPDIAGSEEFNGCPDTDGDGIPDHLDKCPEVAGPEEFEGCPDTDGDGIPDHLDECPEEPGLPENNGCPEVILDRDGDGVPDEIDDCPDIKGLPEFNGCPDTDGDGVPDHLDKCPTVPGTIENNGCPEIEEEVQEILKTAFENLEFETASSTIKSSSLPSLSELADVLSKRPEWDLQISGHTDNVGNPQSNLQLSKKRAEAVKEALKGWGIDESRLHVLYFGDTQPVESNATAEGRQANRRVEMKIIYR